MKDNKSSINVYHNVYLNDIKHSEALKSCLELRTIAEILDQTKVLEHEEPYQKNYTRKASNQRGERERDRENEKKNRKREINIKSFLELILKQHFITIVLSI